MITHIYALWLNTLTIFQYDDYCNALRTGEKSKEVAYHAKFRHFYKNHIKNLQKNN